MGEAVHFGDPNMGKSRAAFTLPEILVVIAVCAVLTSIVYAGYGRAMSSARNAQAIAEIRALGRAALDYAADHDGQLPQSSHQGPRLSWIRLFKQSLPSEAFRNVFDDTGRICSYAINDFVTQRPHGAEDLDYSRIQSIPAPSQTLLFSIAHRDAQNSDHFHFASSGWEPAAFEKEVWVDLTGESGLYLFIDGHAELLPWEEVKSRLEQPNSRFVRPDGGNLIHTSNS